jgi:hypothetical protein
MLRDAFQAKGLRFNPPERELVDIISKMTHPQSEALLKLWQNVVCACGTGQNHKQHWDIISVKHMQHTRKKDGKHNRLDSDVEDDDRNRKRKRRDESRKRTRSTKR